MNRVVFTAGICVLLCCSQAALCLELACQTWRPDRDYNSDIPGIYREGWDIKDANGDTIQYWPKDFYVGGVYEAYITNNGLKPVTLKDVLIDGKSVFEVKPGGQIVWARLSPRRLLPVQTAQLMIRFRRQPSEPVAVKIVADDDNSLSFVFEKDKLLQAGLLSRVSMSEDMKTIYAYVECGQEAFGLNRILLDGYDFTKTAKVLPPYGGQAAIIIPLPGPVENGSEHTILVEHAFARTAVRFRAWPSHFVIAIFDGNNPDNMLAHNFDLNWHHRTPGVIETMTYWTKGIRTIAPYSKRALEQDFEIDGMTDTARNIPGVLADYLPDEPDVQDLKLFPDVEPYYNRIGINAPRMLELAENQRQIDPAKINVLICDSTFRPTNYFVYGRIGDVFVVDVYAISHDQQPLVVYDRDKWARRASEPNPHWMLLGCSYQPASLTRKWKRHATNEEMRLMAYGAIAGGAQGIGYWKYSADVKYRGVAANPKLYHQMGRINGEMRVIGWLLATAQPPVNKNVVKAPAGTIAEVIRCAENKAAILVLLNNQNRSDKNGFVMTPTPNGKVVWTMPDGINNCSLWKLLESGLEKVKYKQTGGVVTFRFNNFGVGGIWVAANDPTVVEQMRSIYKEYVKPMNEKADEILATALKPE